MPTVLRVLLILILIWFAYQMLKGFLFHKVAKEQKRRNTIGNIQIFKKGEVEKPKYKVNAETVDFEEIKKNESQE